MTIRYSDSEDRIRLSGELSAGAPIVVWLTQRLLQRLLPVLFAWLEQSMATVPRAEVIQEFAQQAARAALPPQAPVQAAADSSSWLAQAVDVAKYPQALVLSLRGIEDQQVQFTLDANNLRQWLNIVHDAYAKGGWAFDGWPAWLHGGIPADSPAAMH
jgi:hypothetical protein